MTANPRPSILPPARQPPRAAAPRAAAASRFEAGADLSRINAAAGRLVPVGPLTVRLVEVALDAARRTVGAVDPTVGAHLHDAGYVDDIDHVRSCRQVTRGGTSAAASW